MAIGTAPTSMQDVHFTLSRTLGQIWPNPPRWVGVVMGGTGIAAAATDFWLGAMARQQPPPADTVYDEIAAIYKRAAERMHAEAQPAAPAPSRANVTPAPASRYLASEGASSDVSTGCIPCGRAHLGAQQGMLERAAAAAQRAGGSCDAECQRLVAKAAGESSALLAGDWTPEQVAATPAHQRPAVERALPAVSGITSDLVGGDQAREAMVRASALLTEATRFAGAGDGLAHPEVRWRLDAAEKDLVFAERSAAPGTLPQETQQKLRALRQDVLNKTATPEDLVAVASRAEGVTAAVVAPYAAGLGADRLQELAGRAAAVRERFKADLSAPAAQPAFDRRAPAGHASHEVSGALLYVSPTAATARDELQKTNVQELWGRIERAMADRGVPMDVRNLPPGVEARYVPGAPTEGGRGSIQVSPGIAEAGGRGDPYALQVIAHEVAHALFDGPECAPRVRGVPAASLGHQVEEERAELTSTAVLAELGLPIRTYDQETFQPGQYEVDWQRAARVLHPDTLCEVRWGTDWQVAAARGATIPTGTCAPCGARGAAEVRFGSPTPPGAADATFAAMVGNPYSAPTMRQPKPFEDQRFPFTLRVQVDCGGDVWEDAVKGLNAGHALARARDNWEACRVTPLGRG